MRIKIYGHSDDCGQRGHGIDDGTTTWRECAAGHAWGHVQHRAD